MEGPKKDSHLHVLGPTSAQVAFQVAPGGTRLTPDSESPENSDLAGITERVPPLVFVTFDFGRLA